MDTFPLVILLVPYALMLVIALLFLFFNVYHLWKYGVEGKGTTLLIVMYLVLFAAVVGGTWSALQGFSWNDRISFADILPSFSSSSLGL